MNAVRRSVAVAMALALMAGGLAAGARDAPSSRQGAVAQRTPPRAGVALSMDQAIRLVERRYRARVVRAETRTQGDRTIYVLRMLDGSGRVFSVRVDAASGTIL